MLAVAAVSESALLNAPIVAAPTAAASNAVKTAVKMAAALLLPRILAPSNSLCCIVLRGLPAR